MRRMNEAAGQFPGILVSLDRTLEQEFERQVRASADLAVRVAFSILRQHEDAEEAAQEAFARAYANFGTLRNPDQFRAWIVRVTWRIAIDRWRSDRRRQARETAANETTHGSDPEQLLVASDRASRLWKAIDTLPDKLRLAIVLSAVEGHDVREVAKLLRVPEGTVKSRLFQARKQLAQRLRCLANDSATR
jgi:RNA polymerase sigma-70 factor (ECF subfamily)